MTIIRDALAGHQQAIASLAAQDAVITAIAAAASSALRAGNHILLMGNGGSAADAQHIAAEIVGRFLGERRGLPAIALTTDTSALTAIANDYGYERIFARQVEAHCRPGDVVIGISTSGGSANVVAGLAQARELGAITVGLTGAKPGRVGELSDHIVAIDHPDTARVQEAHITAGHLICALIDAAWEAV